MTRMNFSDGNYIEFGGSRGFSNSVWNCIAPIFQAYLAVGAINHPEDSLDDLRHEVKLAKAARDRGESFKGIYVEYTHDTLTLGVAPCSGDAEKEVGHEDNAADRERAQTL